MKKLIIPVLMLLPLWACDGTATDKGDDIDTAGYTIFKVDTEDLQIEGSSLAGKWENGDCIGVFGSEAGSNVPYSLKRSGEGLKAATFYGELVKGDIQAYFPYADGVASGEGTLPCELDYVQTFDSEESFVAHFLKYNSRSFASLGPDATLHFRYPMGLMNLQVGFDEPVAVNSVTLNSTLGIAGRLEVEADGSVKDSGLAHKYISLDLGADPVPSKTDAGITHFLFVLPPRTYAAGELSLVIGTADEEIHIMMKETVIQRVSSTAFPVTEVTVGTSDIAPYNKEDGYFE